MNLDKIIDVATQNLSNWELEELVTALKENPTSATNQIQASRRKRMEFLIEDVTDFYKNTYVKNAADDLVVPGRLSVFAVRLSYLPLHEMETVLVKLLELDERFVETLTYKLGVIVSPDDYKYLLYNSELSFLF